MTDANTFPQPILITGGAGFLGSHMMALCLEKQTDVVVIDNLINSDLSNLQKLESHFKVSIPFYNIDMVKYYVNEKNISSILFDKDKNHFKYKLINKDQLNLDKDLIFVSFPQNEPKYFLIKND